MRGWLGLGLIVVSVGQLGVPTAAAQQNYAPDSAQGAGRDRTGRPTEGLVVERLSALSEAPRAEEFAGDALAHARRALRRSRELARGGRQDAAERARQIAWAALSLASRQIARAQEREALEHARRERAAAEDRVARAREALQHALRQRERATPRAAQPPAAAAEGAAQETAE